MLERIAKATGPAIYEESLQTRSGALLVTLCVRAARPTTEPIEIENDAEPQEPAPVLEDQLQGVAWLAGEQLVVLDGAIGTGTGGCHSWHLRDVVDIDEDGNPEVVLIRYDEDVEEFQIESIIDGGGVYRWSGVLPAV